MCDCHCARSVTKHIVIETGHKYRNYHWAFSKVKELNTVCQNYNNNNNNISISTAIFPGGPGLADTRMSPFWILLELKDGGDGDNCGYKTFKAPVKSSPPAYSFLQARCPSCRPTNSLIARKLKIIILIVVIPETPEKQFFCFNACP